MYCSRQSVAPNAGSSAVGRAGHWIGGVPNVWRPRCEDKSGVLGTGGRCRLVSPCSSQSVSIDPFHLEVLQKGRHTSVVPSSLLPRYLHHWACRWACSWMPSSSARRSNIRAWQWSLLPVHPLVVHWHSAGECVLTGYGSHWWSRPVSMLLLGWLNSMIVSVLFSLCARSNSSIQGTGTAYVRQPLFVLERFLRTRKI